MRISIQHARALGRRLLVDERGISLIVAVMTLVVISIMVGSVAVYTTNNLRTSYSDRSQTGAYHLAEAGLNEAVSRITAAADPTDPNLLPETTVTYAGMNGSVTYSGTAQTVAGPPEQIVWTVTATGQASSGQQRRKTLTQTVSVKGLVPGADLGSWSRFYQDSSSSCLTIDTVSMPAPLATKGPLCLVNGGSVTGSSTTIDVGGNVTISGPGANAGPRNPTTASGWTNSTNAYTSNNVYATNAIAAGDTGAVLSASNFGFSVPSTAKILGITVGVERKSSTSFSTSDSTVYLQKAGAQVGSNKASGTSWGTSDSTKTYGTSSNLWGTTWTAADVNDPGFGLLFKPRNTSGSSITASVDMVSVTVTYTTDTNGIGASGSPIADATIGGTCTYNAQSANTPCTSTDHVWANTITMADANPDLVMPTLDLDYWFQNARPGPKHYCTNSGNNFAPLAFDNDNSANWNASLQFDNSGTYDITPTSRDYDCQEVENGVMLGRLAWNHTTHVLTVSGAIFFDGDVRFDDDGQLVHYQGRAIIYAAHNVEFDELVCAGGSGTSQSCINSMSSWNPAQNYLVLMALGDSEYDQGGSGCSGLPSNGVTCNGSHPASGLQGVVSAQGDCLIHERFRLSGPVVCNTISLPYESDGWPTYYPFPSLDSLVDGQKYGNISDASTYEVSAGPMTG